MSHFCPVAIRMLPRDQLLRLSDEQEKVLLKSESTLEKLRKYKSDYEKLSQQLETLPHKLEYQMMIPFGRKAFIPGKLVHTNEILVLLGENWFVECSAKYASEIAKRRIALVEKQITEVSKEHENVSGNLKFSKEFSDGENGTQEILEYENELGEVTTIKGPKPSNTEGGNQNDEEEKRRAIARVEAELEELERLEALEEGTTIKSKDTKTNKGIRSTTIHFHHSNIETKDTIPHTDMIYQTPADIYDRSPDRMRKVQNTQPEEIPVRKVTWGENRIESIKGTVKPEFTKEAHQAFTTVVKERNEADSNIQQPRENRIVSKFKSSRQNK